MDNTIRFNQTEILELDQFYRRNLINTLAGFKSANLIGTISNEGVTNLAIFNSVVHLGANPPLMGFVLRPTTVPRNTYKNILNQKYYTFNHIHKSFVEEAHHTSAKYPEGKSEFEVTGLKVENSELHPAPYVAESKIKIGLKYVEDYTIKANQTILVVGEVVELILPSSAVGEDGFIHLEKAETVAISGLDAYYETTRMARFAFARPGEETKEID